MASPQKKPKINSKAKNYFIKQNQKANKQFLKAGDKGYLITFNFKPKDSVREVYKLLNEYHKEFYGGKEEKVASDEEDDDITAQITKAIDETKKEVEKKAALFQFVDTGANGCIFIKSNIDEFYELGEKIVRELSTMNYKKTKFTNRMIPILKVCRASMEDILNASGELFDEHFLKEPCTFAINFNKRFNNDIQRDVVIKELAALVSQKNISNKVNLKDPKKTILVEVIKGLCCITVLTDYVLLKKYNLNELSVKTDKNAKETDNNADETDETDKNADITASSSTEPEKPEES